MHSQKIGHHLPLLHAIWGLETNEFKQFELANGNILRRIIYLHAESLVTTSVLDRGDVNIPGVTRLEPGAERCGSWLSNCSQHEVDKTLNKLAQSDIHNLLLNLQILRKL